MMFSPFTLLLDVFSAKPKSEEAPTPRSSTQLIAITGRIALACFAAYKIFPLIVNASKYMINHHPILTIGLGASVTLLAAIPGILLATTAFYLLIKSEP
ncbi:MAG: hypothetical protein ACOYL1_06565 [Chlamydiia bacterium]